MTAEQNRQKVQKEFVKHELKHYLLSVCVMFFTFFCYELATSFQSFNELPTWEILSGVFGTALMHSFGRILFTLSGQLNHSVVNPVNMDDVKK